MLTDEGVVLHQRNPYGADGQELVGNLVWDGGLALAKFCAWREKVVARRLRTARYVLAVGACAFVGALCVAALRDIGLARLAAVALGAASALGLARRARRLGGRASLARNMYALELGAGTGVVGLTLGRLGARVTLTDKEAEVLDLIGENVAANGLEARIRVRRLDFGDPATYVTNPPLPDLVVAAEVLYEGAHAGQLSRTLDAHVLRGSGAEVLLAYSHRQEAPLELFLSELARLGFRADRLEDRRGQAVAAARGAAAAFHGGSRFRALPSGARAAAAAVRDVRLATGNEGGPGSAGIQILRLTRPKAGRRRRLFSRQADTKATPTGM